MLNAEKFRDEIFDDNNNLICNKASDVFCRETEERNFNHWGKMVRWLLSEYQEPPILDEVEREYLSAVCKPYEVGEIVKTENKSDIEWICISVFSETKIGICNINLPYFNAKTAYRGMKLNKHYTPQELGVRCKNNPNGEIKRD